MSLLTIFGGPGCGKTTRLLKIVEDELASGVPPTQICFTTFTRKAAEEAKTRAAVKFGLDPGSDLKWFSTLHSLAFRSLGLSRGEVLGAKQYLQVADLVGNPGLTIGGRLDDDATGFWTGPRQGDICIFIEQLARTRLITVDEVAGEMQFDKWDARLWSNALTVWKKRNHYVDFTDMLERAVDERAVPSFRVLIVDEAQDLSPLQWKLVRSMAANAERVYIGGDDDQAIYEWSGADVSQFLDIAEKGRIEVLAKSHRLPRRVFDAVNKISSWISRRQAKTWEPANEGGVVDQAPRFDESGVDLSPANGSWYVLARNRCFLKRITAHFFAQGIPYIEEGRSSLDCREVLAARTWTTLQRGGEVDLDHARQMLRITREKLVTTVDRRLRKIDNETVTLADMHANGLVETSAPWDMALEMPPEMVQYIRMVRKNGYKLTVQPWIVASTIHQVKGGEADNVWLETNMTRRPYRALVENPDSEHRVFYVGASRAKRALHVAQKSTQMGYWPFATTGVEI